MKKTGTEGIQKGIISGTLVVVLVLTAFVGADFSTRKDAKAGTGTNTGTAQATVTEELTAKRSKLSNSLPCLTAVLPLPFIPCPSITKRTEDGKKSTPLW